jgi:hypothetical protein
MFVGGVWKTYFHDLIAAPLIQESYCNSPLYKPPVGGELEILKINENN